MISHHILFKEASLMPVVNLRKTLFIPSSGEYMLCYHRVVVC